MRLTETTALTESVRDQTSHPLASFADIGLHGSHRRRYDGKLGELICLGSRRAEGESASEEMLNILDRIERRRTGPRRADFRSRWPTGGDTESWQCEDCNQ